MKRAHLVLGPESTGTRLATQILTNGGCHGSADHFQAFDGGDFGGLDPVVWRRSVPHYDRPLHLRALLDKLGDEYRVDAIVTVRDWDCTIRSAVANSHAPSGLSAAGRMAAAYLSIFRELERYAIPFRLLVYESLVLNPRDVQAALWRALELPGGAETLPVRDGNTARW